MTNEERERAQRDQNPHKAARAAMWIWREEYAGQALGSMGFWDQLSQNRKALARQCVKDIEDARPEGP